MLASNVGSQKLFSKNVPITVKDPITKQRRSTTLFIELEWQESTLRKQVLSATLTDNNDPFFLYNLHLSEEDFHVMRNTQEITADFFSFPQKIIDYLEKCIAENIKSQPEFVSILHVGEKIGGVSTTAQLDFVQAGSLRPLIHLSLKFLVATESSVKEYLVLCFRNLKEANENLKNRICFTEKDFTEKLTSCQELLEKKSQELDIVRKELNVELSMKESLHARELNEERDKFFKKRKEEETRNERERLEREENLKRQIQQLESRVSVLDSLNREIQDKNHKQESTIRELRTRLLSLEEDLKKNKDSLRSSKEQSDRLQNDVKDKRVIINHQKEKIGDLEQEVHHQKQHVNKLQEQLDSYHRQIKKLERDLDENKVLLREKEDECEKLERDISKANDVIQNLLGRLESADEKRKDLSLLKSKIQDKDRVIESLRSQLSDSRLECKEAQNEVKAVQNTVTSLQKNLDSLKTELNARDQVIKYLNHKLTSTGVIPPYVPPEKLVISHPTITQKLERRGAGDNNEIATNNSPTAVITMKRKSIPTRVSFPLVQNDTNVKETVQTSCKTVDSAYATSPSCNTKSSNVITGAASVPQSNFEIDSQTLSAAFGSDRILKHSTAKKQQTSLKSSRNTKSKK